MQLTVQHIHVLWAICRGRRVGEFAEQRALLQADTDDIQAEMTPNSITQASIKLLYSAPHRVALCHDP